MLRVLLIVVAFFASAVVAAQAVPASVVVGEVDGCTASLSPDDASIVVRVYAGSEPVELECGRRVHGDLTPDPGVESARVCDIGPDADGVVAIFAGEQLRAAIVRFGMTAVALETRDVVPGDDGLRELVTYATNDDVSRVSVYRYHEGTLHALYTREYSDRMSAAELRRAVRFPQPGTIIEGGVRLVWDATTTTFVRAGGTSTTVR